MRAKLWLTLWLIGILFPIAGFRQFSRFRGIFDTVFSPNWMHVIMHMALFAGLTVLLFLTFRWPPNKRSAAQALLIVLAVGLLQEGFQAGVQAFWLKGALYDLVVDLSGGIVGCVACTCVFKRANTRRFLHE
ncbi:MAG: hypothetical protein ACOYYS_12355 [Chloroflexota bacterium]